MLIFIISLVIVVLFVIISFLAPRTYEVSRSIVINKPHFDVFQYLKFIKNQDHWSPWKKKDPDMKQEFYGIDGEVGFIAKWNGNSEVGSGEQEITHIVNNQRIETRLVFFKPWKSESNAFMFVEDLGKMQTKVTWGFSGNVKFPANLFMLFYNMDKTVGKDFEEGLINLKSLLEKA
ncbi:SRPBCC family protein [Yeosuana sp.]|uniref:SRPBCC family protein n=1 Tax=Yeosuana sp. TaxID=2529388 RepID=UPI00405503E2|tara:strand:- start:1356 stop:1883 length:528 start_codon:yes stop_codon:yes gene_type:complete